MYYIVLLLICLLLVQFPEPLLDNLRQAEETLPSHEVFCLFHSSTLALALASLLPTSNQVVFIIQLLGQNTRRRQLREGRVGLVILLGEGRGKGPSCGARSVKSLCLHSQKAQRHRCWCLAHSLLGGPGSQPRCLLSSVKVLCKCSPRHAQRCHFQVISESCHVDSEDHHTAAGVPAFFGFSH